MTALLLIGLVACGPREEDEPVDQGDPADDLVIPDLSDIDLEAAWQDGLSLTVGVTMGPAWDGHLASLGLMQSGCPDLYAGSPNLDEVEAEPGEGLGWADACTSAGGLTFSGYAWWDIDVQSEGEADSAEGRTTTASRTLLADGSVGDDDGLLFDFDGEGTDSLYLAEAEGYERWVYSSLVEATVTGRDVFDPATSLTPDGFRTDLYLYATGGDVDTVELRGNAYFFGPVLAGRFDSVAVDLTWTGPTGAGPDDCAAEPSGYISLRDEDAFWYDLVFLPASEDDATGEDYENDPYSGCDGCGTLYVRGLPQQELCPDLSFLWDGAITRPEVEDFVLTLRDLEAP